jgi:hypothetical protein
MSEGHKSQRAIRLFLCHSSADKPSVRQLYSRLFEDGFAAWLDERDLLPGQDWQLEIRKAVRNSDVVLVCLSKDSIKKTGFVQKEIRYALDIADEQPEGTIFLIPVRLEQCDVPERLNQRHWVNLYEPNGYERLLQALEVRAGTLVTTLRKAEKEILLPDFPINLEEERLTPLPEPLINLEDRTIEYVEGKNTNYIFLFGSTATGKTSVSASVIFHLAITGQKFGDVEFFGYEDDPAGYRMLGELLEGMSKGILPGRTPIEQITHLSIRYRPKDRSKPSIPITFLDMAGSDLVKIKSGCFHKAIDVFFRADRDKVSMLYILITSENYAAGDDKLMIDFLNYITSHNSRFQFSRVLLLISPQGDYSNNLNVKEFIQKHMPLTWSKIERAPIAYRYFTLGDIKREDRYDRIVKYDEEPAREIFNWIYYTINGKHLESWWSRISRTNPVKDKPTPSRS